DRVQLDRFREVLRSIPERPRLVHAAASAGVAAFGAVEGMNAVRTGLAIYGLHAAPHLADALPLRPALTWRSRVHRLASVPAGTGVSYGHEYRLPRDGRIATVPVGHGAGLPRAAAGSFSRSFSFWRDASRPRPGRAPRPRTPPLRPCRARRRRSRRRRSRAST